MLLCVFVSICYSDAVLYVGSLFFFNDTATTEIYTYLHTLSLHDALPILPLALMADSLYSCLLLTLTFYTPYNHNIAFLRSLAEGLDRRLYGIWPETNRRERSIDRKSVV